MDQKDLSTYCMRIADDSLILGQRLGEWCGHGPVLEEDIALTNVALDILGQSRVLFDYVSQLDDRYANEDEVAFLREEIAYTNLLLTEQPNGDYAHTIFRQFLFDVFRFYFFTELLESKDDVLRGLAEKAIKETTYHRAHSAEWVKRLGDGTEESHSRMQEAVDTLWMYSDEIFESDEVDARCVSEGIGADLGKIKELWEKEVKGVIAEATLSIPDDVWMQTGGRFGKHSEHLGYLLADMQYMQRAYPNLEW